MRTKLSKIAQAAALGFALIFTVSSFAAANNPSALVGRWVGVSGEEKDNVMELLNDGTGILTKKGSEGGFAITWKAESGRFYMTASEVASAPGYKVQGSLLTFTEDNGKVSEYTKCNKDCKEAAKAYAEAALKAKFKGVKKGSFTDSRDGKSYKTVKFDDRTWMAENLNFNAEGSRCFGNQESNCKKYGRLYDWNTTKTACPKDWHLPSDAEWGALMQFVNPSCSPKDHCENAGKLLKASNGWDYHEGKSGNGTNDVVFSALPGGYGSQGGTISDFGKNGYWWSATEDGAAYAWGRYIYYSSANVYRDRCYKINWRSVRCVQD
jgi:uncharacterized protein (TIGR02145 family)